MNLKKIVSLLMLAVLVIGLSACGNKVEEKPKEEQVATEEQATEETNSEESNFDTSATITVISREDGSGTRGAFTEITGVLEKVNDKEVDNTYVEAMIQNSTNGVMTAVTGDPNGIGYISLGSLNETVKAVQVEGVEAKAENVKDGSYKLARPFNIAWEEDVIGEIGKDFLNFILSKDGQAIVVEEGYVSATDGEAYTATNLEGTITVAGSTSVTPVMEVLAEAYEALNPGVSIEIQSTGSSAGMTSAMEGSANLGMASRELKDKENEALSSTVIAIDGIAVVVNNENPLDKLTMDQIKNIFIGEITTWSEVE